MANQLIFEILCEIGPLRKSNTSNIFVYKLCIVQIKLFGYRTIHRIPYPISHIPKRKRKLMRAGGSHQYKLFLKNGRGLRLCFNVYVLC